MNVQKYFAVASKMTNKYAKEYINEGEMIRMEGDRKIKQDTEGRKVQNITKKEGKKEGIIRKNGG